MAEGFTNIRPMCADKRPRTMAAFLEAHQRKTPEQGTREILDDLEQVVLKDLCIYGGSLSLTALNEALIDDGHIGEGSSEQALRHFLTVRSPHNVKLFCLEEDSKRDECTVRAKTDAVLCKSYNPKQDSCKEGGSCRAFHLCIHFVSNKCRRGAKCGWPHHLRTPHNLGVLMENGLSGLDDDDILQILRQTWVDITVPDVCKHYNTQTGCTKMGDCHFLHVCRHYVLGDCKFAGPNKQGCRYSHNLKDLQPMKVWKRFHIDAVTRNERDLLQLIHEKKIQENPSRDEDEEEDEDEGELTSLRSHARESDGNVPAVCILYNGKGCTKGDRCGFLHICSFYAIGKCRYSGKCRLSHNVRNSHEATVWSRYGIDASSKSDDQLLALLQRKNGQEGQGDGNKGRQGLLSLQAAASDNPEVCEYNLRGKCNFGDGCRKLHSEQHYQWQYRPDGQTWTNFNARVNVQIEKQFCDIRVEYVKFRSSLGKDTLLCFKTMKWSSMEVRRVETRPAKSSEANSWQKVLATSWQWHFKDNDSIWVQYAKNTEVEEAYQKFLSTGQDSTFEFDTDKFSYVLDFQSMMQKNKRIGTKREVRRRPKFVTKEALDRNLQRKKVLSYILPETWDPHAVAADSQNNFVLCRLDPSLHQEEERLVSRRFAEKMDPKSIIRIERVQNDELWHEFTVKRDHMRDRQTDSSKAPEELLLFHGTEEKVIPAICQQNFDFRISGSRVGTKYGQGSYFSKSAKYSDSYASPDSKGRGRMFLVRVLVGAYTLGDPSYRRPPLKDKSKLHGPLFDSCVDNLNDPLIFVIFDRAQVYPEYLITYKK